MTPLLPLSTVRNVTGKRTEQILADVESGALRWVWHIGKLDLLRAQCLCLRFWQSEITNPQSVARLTPQQVCAAILPEHRTKWRGVELSIMFICSRPTIHRLHKSKALPGQITGNTLWVHRPALESFLLNRLVTL
jgi:hypothetical protein